jgi:membrane fusion protein, multidrug efflux system
VLRRSIRSTIAARVPGFIEERNFTEGQQVKKGDLLFRIEQATYKAAVEQRRAVRLTPR